MGLTLLLLLLGGTSSLAQTEGDSTKIYNPEYERWKAAILEWETFKDSLDQVEMLATQSSAATHSALTGMGRTWDSTRAGFRQTHTSKGQYTPTEERVMKRGGSSLVGPKKRVPEMVLEAQVELEEKGSHSNETHFLKPGKYGRLKIIHSSYEASDSLLTIGLRGRRRAYHMTLKFTFGSGKAKKVKRVHFEGTAGRGEQIISVSGFQKEPTSVLLGYGKEFLGTYEYFPVGKQKRK